jgi:hypothetical protein
MKERRPAGTQHKKKKKNTQPPPPPGHAFGSFTHSRKKEPGTKGGKTWTNTQERLFDLLKMNQGTLINNMIITTAKDERRDMPLFLYGITAASITTTKTTTTTTKQQLNKHNRNILYKEIKPSQKEKEGIMQHMRSIRLPLSMTHSPLSSSSLLLSVVPY